MTVFVAPPLTSRISIASRPVLKYARRCPSGDHRTLTKPEDSSASSSLRALLPSTAMTHSSRGPCVTQRVVKATSEPSGETDSTKALSRSERGAPPTTETNQTLECTILE